MRYCFLGGEPCGQNEPGPKKITAVRAVLRRVLVAGVQVAHVPGTRAPDHVHDAERREYNTREHRGIESVVDFNFGRHAIVRK